MQDDEFLMDDLPPLEGEKPKKKDPKLDLLLLQVTACAALILIALVIKLVGGGFYAEARDKYVELFEDQTTLSEVMETMGGVFQMTPSGGSSDPAGAAGSPASAVGAGTGSDLRPRRSLSMISAMPKMQTARRRLRMTLFMPYGSCRKASCSLGLSVAAGGGFCRAEAVFPC